MAGVLVMQPHTFTAHNAYFPFTPTTAEVFIEQVAEKYKIDKTELLETLKCESSLKATAVGDGGKSFGIAQIHSPSHPTITREQALDPYWAMEWTAKEFSEGRKWQWTCARNLGFVTDG